MRKPALYHLRKISVIRKYLTFDTAQLLVHALITSQLDYCILLLYGLPKHVTKQLQRVQKIAYLHLKVFLLRQDTSSISSCILPGRNLSSLFIYKSVKSSLMNLNHGKFTTFFLIAVIVLSCIFFAVFVVVIITIFLFFL